MKYPCSTCEHYRRDKFNAGRCDNPLVASGYTHGARLNRRYSLFRDSRGCGNGRRHSAYVSVWRRAWAGFWSALTQLPVKIPKVKVEPKYKGFNFEDRKPVSLFSERYMNLSDMVVPKLIQTPEPKHDFENGPREAGLWR